MNNIKIVAGLIITQNIVLEETKEYVRQLQTYIDNVDKLYILNVSSYDIVEFVTQISRYPQIDYAKTDDHGEAINYDIIYKQALKDNADIGVVITQAHYYEEEVFLNLKRYYLENDCSHIAVLTPMPLYGSQTFEKKAELIRPCMGCKLDGAFVNMYIYQKLQGIRTDYYQTTFDYEYCLRARKNAFLIMVMQNEVYRDLSYKTIEKRIFTMKRYIYEIDATTLYYLVRNRLFLWDEYKDIDPKYIKLDKKLSKAELVEIKHWDKHKSEKFEMVKKARKDYKDNKLGKISY